MPNTLSDHAENLFVLAPARLDERGWCHYYDSSRTQNAVSWYQIHKSGTMQAMTRRDLSYVEGWNSTHVSNTFG